MVKSLDRQAARTIRTAVVMAASCFATGKPRDLAGLLGADEGELDDLSDRLGSELRETDAQTIEIEMSAVDIAVAYRCVCFTVARYGVDDLALVVGENDIGAPELLGNTRAPAVFD